MTGNIKLLRNFVEKFMGTIHFGNDHFDAITGNGDYVHRNVTFCHVYYVEGLGHNLFFVGQFCDEDLGVAFRSKICYIWNLEGDDLLTGSRESNLYTISISKMTSSSLVCLMSKASSTRYWLWHRCLSHINFSTINQLAKQNMVIGFLKFKYNNDHLYSAFKYGKSKRTILKPKPVTSADERLQLLHMDLCGPMRVESINGKRYILVILDDYSRYTWVYFHRSKDEDPEMIKKFITRIQVSLCAIMRFVRTDNGTILENEMLKLLRNRTLVEAARTMLIFSHSLNFLWTNVISIACFTQNRSLIHSRYNKTPYELIRERKPNVQFFHVFGSLCHPTNDQDDLGKLKPKADIGIFIGYFKDSKGFRICNLHTRKIMKTIYVKFDELTAMTSEQDSLELNSNHTVFEDSSAEPTHTPSKEDVDDLFGPLYAEYFVGRPKQVSTNFIALDTSNINDIYSSTTIIVDADETPHIISTSEELTFSQSNDNADEPNQEENAELDGKTFFNPFCSPVFEEAGSSSSQLQYTLEILKKHGMDGCDSIGTPMATSPKLDADLHGVPMDPMKYHSMIGALIKTYNMGLWYSKDSGFELIAYSDADLAGCHDDCKSTLGDLHFLG
ncbi:retrovirus-related pol polyprotein from transposon TNT 1-94 [Tanacetum coccineum]